MVRYLNGIVCAIFILLIGSCKKDMLHVQHVQQLNSNTTSRLNNIHFIGGSTCIVAGGETFYSSVVVRSTDGGYTWSSNSYPDAPKEMYGMGVSPDGNIYLSGIDGDVLHSKDSGKTWQFDRINDWLVYFGGYFPSHDTGIFVSSVLQRQCTITRVTANFNIIDEKTYIFGLNNIYMPSPAVAYVIGYGTVMKTTDKGNTWNFQDVQGDDFTAMDIHGNEIWMCGANGSIYHTNNGGNKWDVLRNGNDITIPKYYLRSMVFKDELHGWACGDDGKLIATDDGGHHWAEYDRFTTNTLRSITLCPNGDLLVCGDNGALYRIKP